MALTLTSNKAGSAAFGLSLCALSGCGQRGAGDEGCTSSGCTETGEATTEAAESSGLESTTDSTETAGTGESSGGSGYEDCVDPEFDAGSAVIGSDTWLALATEESPDVPTLESGTCTFGPDDFELVGQIARYHLECLRDADQSVHSDVTVDVPAAEFGELLAPMKGLEVRIEFENQYWWNFEGFRHSACLIRKPEGELVLLGAQNSGLGTVGDDQVPEFSASAVGLPFFDMVPADEWYSPFSNLALVDGALLVHRDRSRRPTVL